MGRRESFWMGEVIMGDCEGVGLSSSSLIDELGVEVVSAVVVACPSATANSPSSA